MSRTTVYYETAERLYRSLRESQSIPGAWEKWAEYRKELTDYLLRSTRAGSTVTVFGAGECNDLDLSCMLQHFGRISLYDAHMAAMQCGLKRQGVEKRSEIQLIQSDFVGISGEAYVRYAEQLLMEREIAPGNELAGMQQLERLYHDAVEYSVDFGTDCYDYAVVIGVDSQLNNMAEWLRYMIYRTEESELTQRIRQENEVLVRRFHDAVWRAVKEQCFFGCERECLGQPGAIEGAVQSLWDIEDRLNRQEIQLLQGMSLYWPFDMEQEKIFRMELWNLKKK